MEKLAFIIDDDDAYSNYIKTFLHHFGYEVKIYSNGTDCYNSLNQHPKFIILDHNLGGNQDGLELLRVFKSEKPDLPIIYLSGQQNITKAIEALKLGSLEYIEKNSGTLIQLKGVVEKLEKKKKGIASWFSN